MADAQRSPSGSRGPQARRFLWRRPRSGTRVPLAGPMGWLVVAYLGSLAVLFAASLWRLDTFTGEIVQDPGFQNFRHLAEGEVYRTIVHGPC